MDKNLLMEVFENLLGNALRYGEGQVQVKAVLAGREFTIFVKDDGPGFSEKALQLGAETYFSEEENSQEHFGIGLSICRMLCEIHGGRLALQPWGDCGRHAVRRPAQKIRIAYFPEGCAQVLEKVLLFYRKFVDKFFLYYIPEPGQGFRSP